MIFIIIPLIVFLSAIVLLLIRKYTSVEFVSHARMLFKTWSVWLAGAGASIGAVVTYFPDAALSAWQALPEDIKSTIPPNYMGYIGPTLVGLGILSQYVRQKSLVNRVGKNEHNSGDV